MDAQDMKQVTTEAVNTTIKTLETKGLIAPKQGRSRNTAHKKTEVLLYNYLNFKRAIKDYEAMIKEIRKINPTSKSVTSAVGVKKMHSGEDMSEAEVVEAKIEALERNIVLTKVYVKMVEESLEYIKDEPYSDIIRFKYFEKLSTGEIADRLHADTSTIDRQKCKLLDKLKIRLFGDEVLMGILSS